MRLWSLKNGEADCLLPRHVIGYAQGHLVSDGGVSGTVRWMAPEVMQEEPTTSKADVYSFGIVLWEIFTRRLPFRRFNLAAVRCDVCLPRVLILAALDHLQRCPEQRAPSYPQEHPA
jgi:serine/threonine protein kinase